MEKWENEMRADEILYISKETPKENPQNAVVSCNSAAKPVHACYGSYEEIQCGSGLLTAQYPPIPSMIQCNTHRMRDAN